MLTPCILAEGTIIKGGYVLVYVPEQKRQWLAHRLAWTEAHGAIPPGLYVCHNCDMPACRNVEHLFLGTALQNMQDAVAKHRIVRPSTCKRGHNEWSTRRDGTRRCRACHRAAVSRTRSALRIACRLIW